MAQQNTLDFLVAAHVSGMEQMAKLMNSVGALQRETERLKAANANLTNSNNSVIQSGTRYNNALDAQAKQLRNARQGTQQLGMQINDFATSVSTGASVSQAFNQQLGQLGYAMSMMGGTAGKVGAFLAGPWGAAITLAVVALGPFIDKLGQAVLKLFDTETALDRVSKKAAESMAALKNSLSQTSKQSEAMTDVAMKAAIASKAYADSKKNLESLQRMGPPISGNEGALTAYYRRLQAVTRETERLRQEANKYSSEVETIASYNRVRGMQATASAAQNTAPKSLGGSASSAARSLSPFEKDSQKEAEASARWYANLQGEYVKEYQDYRVAMIKSDEGWAATLAKLEDESSNNSIDAAAQRAKEIGYISTANTEKIAKDWDVPRAALEASFQSIGQTVSDAFKGMITGATSWKDAMRGIINSVIDQLWQLYVVQQIVGFVTKALGQVGAPLPGPVESVSPFMKAANGTINSPGGLTWVGERGPELLNLPRGSQVIPAHRAQSMGGGGVTVNVDARGSADPAAVRAQVEAGIMQAAPAIIAAAQQRTVSSLRRPRLGGAMQ